MASLHARALDRCPVSPAPRPHSLLSGSWEGGWHEVGGQPGKGSLGTVPLCPATAVSTQCLLVPGATSSLAGQDSGVSSSLPMRCPLMRVLCPLLGSVCSTRDLVSGSGVCEAQREHYLAAAFSVAGESPSWCTGNLPGGALGTVMYPVTVKAFYSRVMFMLGRQVPGVAAGRACWRVGLGGLDRAPRSLPSPRVWLTHPTNAPPHSISQMFRNHLKTDLGRESWLCRPGMGLF